MKIDKAKIISILTDTPDVTTSMTNEDIKKNQNMSYLAYLSILFLIPLFARSNNSKFAHYHTNQGMVLCLVGIVGDIILSTLSKLTLIGWLFTIVRVLFNLAYILMMIIGLLNVSQGKAKELPFIGKYKFLK